MFNLKYLISLLIISLFLTPVFSQIDSVIIEKYYIASGVDTSEFLFTEPLSEGAVSYRVYLDLKEGSRLIELFGSKDHPFEVGSTEPFFNNTFRGQSFGFRNDERSFSINTVALDTWMTLGLVTRNHMGILKSSDTDGSIDPILNNLDGVLKNENSEMGIALNQADGMIPRDSALEFAHTGIVDLLTGTDSTVFGINSDKLQFRSNNMSLRDLSGEGITGPDDLNRILIMQITTTGDISFSLNVKIKNSNGNIVRYIGQDTLINEDNDEIFSSWLRYPFQLRTGCMDPYYAEYDPLAVRDDGSCRDSVVFGCLDPGACNFNPEANVHMDALCCFNAECALDLDVVCPGTVYGCMDPEAANYNPDANVQSDLDICCYSKGCMDRNYLEFDPSACYQDSTDCKVLIVPGCMDKSACNYNPVANSPKECDYTSCLDDSKKKIFTLDSGEKGYYDSHIYPNPANDLLSLDITSTGDAMMSYSIIDIMGSVMMEVNNDISKGLHSEEINLLSLSPGLYFLQLRLNDSLVVKRFIKQ